MITFLQLWCLLGACTLVVETVRLHRRGSSLRAICAAHARLGAEGGDVAALHRLFGRRWVVVLVTIGLFPLVWTIAIAGLVRRADR